MARAVALLGEVDENPLVMGFEAIHDRLLETLAALNQEHAESLVAPLAVPGEMPEFLAVLTDFRSVYPLSRTIGEALHPLAVRVAACLGEINLPPVPDPEQMDGPAFDGAADLLYRARKDDRLVMIQGENEMLDSLANALFLVLYRDLQNWTERQCKVVRLYRHFRRQQDVAEELGVSQQSVSSSLAASGWKSLAEAEATLAAVFSTYARDTSPSRA